jgi:hypothetical protein
MESMVLGARKQLCESLLQPQEPIVIHAGKYFSFKSPGDAQCFLHELPSRSRESSTKDSAMIRACLAFEQTAPLEWPNELDN